MKKVLELLLIGLLMDLILMIMVLHLMMELAYMSIVIQREALIIKITKSFLIMEELRLQAIF